MEATYTITKHDYVRARKLFLKSTLKVTILYAIAIVILFFTYYSGSLVVKLVAQGVLIAIFIVEISGRFVAVPFLAKRCFKKFEKAIHEPITVKLKDEGVFFDTAHGKGTIRWEEVLKWRQNKGYLLIYPTRDSYHIIPKSIVDTGFNLSSLIEALQSNVGRET